MEFRCLGIGLQRIMSSDPPPHQPIVEGAIVQRRVTIPLYKGRDA
jgi:hypothetical protein